MNLSRRRVRFRFQSFYGSAVLKSQSIIEQLRCTDFYKFLNVWLFLNDWLFLNVLMFDHPPTHPPPYDPPLKCSIPHSYLIRARSTAHSKIFLYKSFFKGLYYTLSHTYNAYTFFSIFLLSNMIYLFFFESYCVLYGAPKGTSVEKTYVISFPRNHFVRTKYVISFPRNHFVRTQYVISFPRNIIRHLGSIGFG